MAPKDHPPQKKKQLIIMQKEPRKKIETNTFEGLPQ